MSYTSEDASFRARLLSDLGFSEDPRWSITELLKRHRTQVLTKEGLGIPALDTRLDTLESGVGFLSPSGSDDTAAIVAAFDTYKVVILDEGTFFSTGFTVPTGRILSGVGTLSIISTTGSVTLGVDSQIRDLVIDGDAALEYLLNTDSGSVVENCTFKNGQTYGIHATGDVDTVIRNNIFKDIPSYALLAEGAVTRIVFEGNTVTNATSGQGVTVKTNAGSPVDTRINNNTVDVKGTIGIEYQVSGTTRGTMNNNVVRGPGIGLSLSAVDGITVSGNTVSDCPTYGIEVAQASTNSNIIGNTVLDCGTGICITSPSASPESSNISVCDNLIKNSSDYGVQIEFGISINISGNTIHEPTNRAIFLNNSPNYCVVSNNVIYRSVTAADNIYLTGQRHLVSGNYINCINLSPSAGYGIHNNGGTDQTISDNYIMGTAKAIALLGGTRHSLLNNVTLGHTEHAVYTLGVTSATINGHRYVTNGGIGVDISGVTNKHMGTYFAEDTGTFYSFIPSYVSDTLGFFSVTPVTRPTAPTAADAGAVNSGDATTDAVINNMRIRIGELETKLRSLGLIT